MNLLRSLLPLCLLQPGALLAQTAATSASTVVFSKASTAATYTSSHAGATLLKAESNQLTFRNADHSFTLVSGSGVAYQQPNGAWPPSQLQVAALNDGSGWNISSVPMAVSVAGSQGQVKVLSIKSGSVTTSFQLPQLSYNGNDTFTFQENGTTWLLRVSEAAVDIEATVAKRTGKMAHTLGYNSFGAALSVDNNGALHIGGAVHVTHPLIVGANRKYYDVCSPWSTTSSGVSFICDDTKLPDAALPYVIDPTFNSGPTSYDSTYFVRADEGCCGTTEYTDNVTWNAYFNISSIPSNAFVQSASVGGASYQWFENYNSQATPACNYAGDGWTTNLGGGIAGGSTLTYTMNFQMGWWNNDYLYECTASVNPALLTATITYTSQEVYTIPNMTGSVSANTGSSATFNVPGGVQYSSWGNPEYFYFNWGDGSASGWVLSSASHTYSSPGTYQVTFQVESSASAPTSAANAWTVTVTGAAASYQGWLDVANCSTIAGWAENTSQINSPLTVSFYVDGAGSASFSTTANQFRQDLLNAGIGTGYYGFSFATPAVLFDGYTLRAVRDNRHAITRESEVRAVRHATDRHNHDNPGRVVGECSWHPEPNVVQSFVHRTGRNLDHCGIAATGRRRNRVRVHGLVRPGREPAYNKRRGDRDRQFQHLLPVHRNR
jgi:hypothetical protein